MKIKIVLALMFAVFSMVTSAQNPIEKIFKVEFLTADGKDSIIEVSKLTTNSFNFIGNKGEVQIYNEATGEWETVEEENKDIYMNVTKVDGFNANISADFSDVVKKLSFEEFGCCISKSPAPEIADTAFVRGGYSILLNLSEFFKDDDKGGFTINIDRDKIDKFEIGLKNLEYITTYYVRPYIKLSNGFIMYGGEKSFTTLKTKAAALAGDENVGSRYFLMEDSVVFTKEALQGLFDKETEITNELWYGMIQDLEFVLNSMVDEEKAELRKKTDKTIKCIDGNLHLVSKLPAKLIEHFKEYFVSGAEFSPIGNVKEVKNTFAEGVDTVYCDESMGVPYNSYLRVIGLTSTSQQSISIYIPKYMHNREYGIYAVFVHPDTVNPLPNYFQTRIYQLKESEKYSVEGSYKLCFSQDEITTDASNSVDTVFIGKYTFTGTPNATIEFRNMVRRNSNKVNYDEIYNRVLNIAKIYIVPVKEDE